jgi:hypothetical protein
MEIKSNRQFSDITPVKLTAEQIKEATNRIGELIGVCGFLRDSLSRLNAEIRTSTLSCAEHYLSDLTRVLGYDSVLATEMEERVVEVREKNTEIRRLEQLIGSQSVETLPYQLSAMTDNFDKFWTDLGFLISHARFTGSYGNARFRAELSCLLCDREERETSVELTKVLDIIQHGSEMRVKDTIHNRDWIKGILLKRFPSIEISGWEIQGWRGEETIRECKIVIRDLSELLVK